MASEAPDLAPEDAIEYGLLGMAGVMLLFSIILALTKYGPGRRRAIGFMSLFLLVYLIKKT